MIIYIWYCCIFVQTVILYICICCICLYFLLAFWSVNPHTWHRSLPRSLRYMVFGPRGFQTESLPTCASWCIGFWHGAYWNGITCLGGRDGLRKCKSWGAYVGLFFVGGWVPKRVGRGEKRTMWPRGWRCDAIWCPPPWKNGHLHLWGTSNIYCNITCDLRISPVCPLPQNYKFT